MSLTICGGINDGFNFCDVDPMIGGVEDLLVLFNIADVKLIKDPTNPNLVVMIQSADGGSPYHLLYPYYGTNNNIGTKAKQVQTKNGPRYEHEVDFLIAGNSTDIKEQIQAMGYGRIGAIVFNNYKDGDSSVEIFGASNGLVANEAERDTASEEMDGAYNIKLTRPERLREPSFPLAVQLPVGATPAQTKAAIVAMFNES
jgi:hypothetical protein